MSEEPKKPVRGSLRVDATPVERHAVDLAVGDLKGFRREKSGFVDAADEIRSNQKNFGARAGVMQADVDRLDQLTAQIEETRSYLGPARKMVEILEETEANHDEERHAIMSTIAATVERRATLPGNEDLLARYEKVRNYRSASAIKAVKTRRKRAAAGKTPPDQGKPAPDQGKPTPARRKSARAETAPAPTDKST
jgi:hypothetical protein